MTTVADAVLSIRERLDEETASQWGNRQLRRWLNEAIRDIARRTFHYQDTITIAVTSGTGEYTVPGNVIRINQCYWIPDGDTTNYYGLEARTWEVMDEIWSNRQTLESGYPAFYTTRGYSPTLTLKLFPVPTEDGDLSINIVRMPDAIDVTSGTGDVDAPDPWLEVAYFYVEYMSRRKDRDADWAMESKQQYDMLVDSMIQNGDYLNAPQEFIFNGRGSWMPDWLTSPNF